MVMKEAAGGRRLSLILRRYRLPPVIPLLILLAAVITAVFAGFIAPYSPLQGSLAARLQPPFGWPGGSVAHLMGTDPLGRDILSRVIYGGRASLTISVLAILPSAAFGSVVGIVSGYFGKGTDAVIMRIVDIFLSFPIILLAFLLAVLFGPSFGNVILIVGLFIWPRFARQARGETLSIKQREFVTLARAAGCSGLRIMWRHIFPNVANTLLVLATLQLGWVILFEASLSFLGVGLPPPTPAWGLMVADGRGVINTAWWISVMPGLAILLVVLSINLLGDWLRDRLDPKLSQI